MNVKKFYENLSPKQIEEGNRKQFEQNKQVYEEFKNAYKLGKCSLCGHNLNEFISYKPCFHWFLRPSGIKKKHFNKYLSTPIGFFQFDSYLRWISNLEKPFGNINDLKSEMNASKVAEYTIKYKNIEWSINIGKTDRFGHENSQNGKLPHFHLQMKVNNNIFIKFNDFHIPLSKEDIFLFRSLEEAGDKVIWKNTYGQGISIIEDEELFDKLDSMMIRTDDVDNATFNTSTLVEMPEGETMNSNDLNRIFNESKESGIPIRHLLKNFYPQASFFTEIKPGDGVPEISKRNLRK